MSNGQKYQTSAVAKSNHYFSRKHEDALAMSAARIDHGVKHGKEHRQISAKLCAEERSKRSDEEQLSLVQKRALDFGMGNAKKERKRLTKRIEATALKNNVVRAAEEEAEPKPRKIIRAKNEGPVKK